MQLQADVRGLLHVLPTHGVVECALLHGLFCGLQNSVIRRRVFDGNPLHAELRNEAEDQLFAIRALKRGYRIGYLDAVHVQYHVHETNSSGAATNSANVGRQLRLLLPVAQGFEQLREEFEFRASESVALRRRLHREYFWHLGYATYRQHGRYRDAFAAYHRGLRQWPWSANAWKTFSTTALRALLN
jgi:hypothetical protein